MPPAVVMVVPATKLVVPVGANQTLLEASPELTIVTAAGAFTATDPANTVSWLLGAVLSTARVAVEALDTLPTASITKSLYEPSVAGAKIEVELPFVAFVMVLPSTKLVVPAGANQTLLVDAPELTIVTAANPFLLTSAANTVLWLVGAVASTLRVAFEAVETLPAASITYTLYAPVVAGATIVVATPFTAFVMVLPATKLVVPSGANQTLLGDSFELKIVTAAPPFTGVAVIGCATPVALVGATLSTVSTTVDPLETLPAASITNSL